MACHSRKRQCKMESTRIVHRDGALKPIRQALVIQGQRCYLEVDTGAPTNFISTKTWEKLGSPTVKPSRRLFTSASDHEIPVLGSLVLPVSIGHSASSKDVEFFVTSCRDLDVIGRGSLFELGISVDSLLATHGSAGGMTSSPSGAGVFSREGEEVGKMKMVLKVSSMSESMEPVPSFSTKDKSKSPVSAKIVCYRQHVGPQGETRQQIQAQIDSCVKRVQSKNESKFGDRKMVYNRVCSPNTTEWWVPSSVVEQRGPWAVPVKTKGDDLNWHRHINQVRRRCWRQEAKCGPFNSRRPSRWRQDA